MNLRNKYLASTIRILFGLFMIFSGVGGLMMIFNGNTQGIPPEMIEVLNQLKANGILHIIKFTETIAGLMLVLNIWPALAAIFIAPIAVGVIVFNSMLAPQYVITGVIVAVIEIYLGYVYWNKYKVLFTR